MSGVKERARGGGRGGVTDLSRLLLLLSILLLSCVAGRLAQHPICSCILQAGGCCLQIRFQLKETFLQRSCLLWIIMHKSTLSIWVWVRACACALVGGSVGKGGWGWGSGGGGGGGGQTPSQRLSHTSKGEGSPPSA